MSIDASRGGAAQPVNEEALYRKLLWRIAPILFLCHLFSFLDRVNIGFAKLQMLGDLHIGDSAFALGASMFFVGYIALEIPSNIVLHRVGARRWIARIMLTWGLISAGTMFTAELARLFGVGNATMFYILRLLLGCCEAGFYPGMLLYINYWFPSDRQTKVTFGLLLALPTSLIFGGPLSGWLMQQSHGWLGYSGWQWMLMIEGIPAMALAFLVYFGLADKIGHARWLTDAEKRLLEKNVVSENAHKEYHFGAALRDYRVWICAGIIFTYATGWYGLSFWLPSIVRESGVKDTFHIGVLTAIPFVFAAATMLFNAWHSSKTGERRWHAAIPAFAGGAGLILSAVFAHNVPVAIVCLCIAASGVLGLTPIVWTYPGSLLSGTAAAAGFAMINSFGSLSGIAGSWITSIVKQMTGSITNGTYALGFVLLCTGVLILSLPAATFVRGEAARAKTEDTMHRDALTDSPA
ncbi:MFS transporter [Caballeronia insecticola]|uniref:Major Facilitator Superfamily protein n=1 Tax=Caballeronia insecticola TaxID=758793 RepID=R4X1S0_9BURK|nr:MFS transporter [Caballeronia insecticola]BAN26271.1 major Facilitator Superfamily protein [Caballeronia insecticola]